MNVKLGIYRVASGTNYGYDLYQDKEVKVKENGVETGEVKIKEVWVSFHANLQQVADKLFWLDLKRSDADTLSECLKVMGATRQLIKTAGWTREDLC